MNYCTLMKNRYKTLPYICSQISSIPIITSKVNNNSETSPIDSISSKHTTK